MKIWITHGYFLTGTGSNLYVQNLSKQLCSMGHDVTLFCQDREFEKQKFIDSGYVFDANNEQAELIHTKVTPYEGKCTCFVPNIGKVLPVYVKDKYEGFDVHEIPQLSKSQLEYYIDCNAKALKSRLLHEKPDMIISNHVVMQPVYVKRALEGTEGIVNFNVVHGSALNFSVRKSELASSYAIEGLSVADGIVFLTEHSMREFGDYFDERATLTGRRILIPAGVDIERFVPLEKGQSKGERIKSLLGNIESAGGVCMNAEDYEKNRIVSGLIKDSTASQLSEHKAELMEKGDRKCIDADITQKLVGIDWENENIVLFYGKYLWTKGIHNIILALPLVLKENPDTRIIIVGYGTSRGYLESVVDALDSGDPQKLEYLLKHPNEFQSHVEQGTEIYSKWIVDMLEDGELSKEYMDIAKGNVSDKVILTGFMDHELLKDMIPCADVAIAPSIFPEAFGLVGVEALACGVIPLQTYHSGFKYVVDTYSELFELDERLKKLDKLWLREDLVSNIALNINTVFEAYRIGGQDLIDRVRRDARKICTDNYSWASVAERFVSEAKAKNEAVNVR
ncbi:glycosyl transferase, group 1 [Peptoclostridium acidaminophilum DSM 3953]|uniref:Glycosyl transferase, group 1 n=1 Tax=Peptoclostridium acidaminophilum DSM 3953 TaxID=1286171 RepID=W8T5D2_PEPAC|nr:glycosyltransferase family 4 protein [Peptoclostridium acidaminophilum]AHM56065.1 glycosyl transferase, group 1 [Peptoclostridium acidaminophilum DSM 3953]